MSTPSSTTREVRYGRGRPGRRAFGRVQMDAVRNLPSATITVAAGKASNDLSVTRPCRNSSTTPTVRAWVGAFPSSHRSQMPSRGERKSVEGRERRKRQAPRAMLYFVLRLSRGFGACRGEIEESCPYRVLELPSWAHPSSREVNGERHL